MPQGSPAQRNAPPSTAVYTCSRRAAARRGLQSPHGPRDALALQTQAQRSEGAAQDYFLSVRDENLRPVGLLKDGSKKTKSRALESVGRPSQEQGSDSLSLTMIDEESASGLPRILRAARIPIIEAFEQKRRSTAPCA